MLRHTTAQFIFFWTHTCIYIFMYFVVSIKTSEFVFIKTSEL